MPSSVGRKQCIQSVQERYAWGRAKMVLMIILSFVTHVIMGTGFYVSDIVTDVNFSLYMLQGYHRATMATSSSSVVLNKCKQEFYVVLDNAYAGCKENYLECLTYLQNATRQVEDCYATEERFDDPLDWWLAGVVSFVHCGLPVFFGLLFWIILELEDNSSGDNWNIFRIPLPFITKMYKFHCDKNYYTLKAQNQDKKDYEKSLQKCQIKIEKHANAVNFSMITEAALESSFQFFFQSVYYIPTLGITKCFNYRVDQKKGEQNKNGHNSSEIHQKGKKLVHFGKFSMIGTKPFKISGEMDEKNELKVGNPPLKFTALDLFHF